MKLHIHPLVALADEKLSIEISEVPPLSKVKVSTSLCLPWAKQVPYESYAWFTADTNGTVNLAHQKPDRGTYDFVDSMGLIVSVKSNDPNAIQKIGEHISVDNSLFIEVVAECEAARAKVTVERMFKAPDLKRKKITDGFVGEFFYTDDPDRQTILNLCGSSGDLGGIMPMSALLASRGFNVLSLSYFNEEGLPKALAEIPLEYFENVFAWLAHHPLTQGREVYLLGTSKGGELALLLASRYTLFAKVVAFAPHAYCFQGLNFKNVSSWSYEGKSLPFIPLRNPVWLAHALRCFLKNEPFGYTYAYRTGVEETKNREAARIKLENAKADVMLFAGKEDNMWNSHEGCVTLMENLKKHLYPHSYEYFAYEHAGHQFFAPYIIPAGESSFQMAPRLRFTLGGTVQGNAHAQADSWEKALAFLKK